MFLGIGAAGAAYYVLKRPAQAQRRQLQEDEYRPAQSMTGQPWQQQQQRDVILKQQPYATEGGEYYEYRYQPGERNMPPLPPGQAKMHLGNTPAFDSDHHHAAAATAAAGQSPASTASLVPRFAAPPPPLRAGKPTVGERIHAVGDIVAEHGKAAAKDIGHALQDTGRVVGSHAREATMDAFQASTEVAGALVGEQIPPTIQVRETPVRSAIVPPSVSKHHHQVESEGTAAGYPLGGRAGLGFYTGQDKPYPHLDQFHQGAQLDQQAQQQYGQQPQYQQYQQPSAGKPSIPERLSDAATVVKEHVKGAAADMSQAASEVGDVAKTHAGFARQDVSKQSGEVGAAVRGQTVQPDVTRTPSPVSGQAWQRQPADQYQQVPIKQPGQQQQKQQQQQPTSGESRYMQQLQGSYPGYQPQPIEQQVQPGPGSADFRGYGQPRSGRYFDQELREQARGQAREILYGQQGQASQLQQQQFTQSQSPYGAAGSSIGGTGTVVTEHARGAASDISQAGKEAAAVIGTHAQQAKKDFSTMGSEVKAALKGEAPNTATVMQTPPLTPGSPSSSSSWSHLQQGPLAAGRS